MIYSDPIDLTAISAADPARLQADPAGVATWEHSRLESLQVIDQVTGSPLGAHQAAVTGPPYSVADSVPVMRPASPGQLATPDLLTSMHQQGQGQ